MNVISPVLFGSGGFLTGFRISTISTLAATAKLVALNTLRVLAVGKEVEKSEVLP